MKRLLGAWFCVSLVSACAPWYTTIPLYKGIPSSESQLAMLYIDPHVAVLRFDEMREPPQNPGAIVGHSAGIRRHALQFEPGHHTLDAQFFLLCRNTKPVTIQFFADPGKKYRLKSEIVDGRYWNPTIVAIHSAR